MTSLQIHPQRFELTNELHARPFQPVEWPGRVLHLAFINDNGRPERDGARDLAHFVRLLDRFGAGHPPAGANHHAVDLGRFRLKWERHTEFVSYTLSEEGASEEGLFRHGLLEHLPADWLAEVEGKVISAVEIELIACEAYADADRMISTRLGSEFNAESLATAHVIDGAALALGDFRIHEAGFTRFAIIVHGETGPRRMGRLVQRLLEIETYQTLALLALPLARRLQPRLTEIANRLAELIGQVASEAGATAESQILAELTALSAEIETIAASSAFRFGAAGAYADLVKKRIENLREGRVVGRQLFGEFTQRRFEPAMRTCRSAEGRLARLASQASRAAELLRTRIDVAVESQNQKLLHSMDKRAALQLRLQETVEGLSVVAISYYAVSLGAYLVEPLAERLELGKGWATALLVPPVVFGVWWMVRRIRRRIARREGADL